MPFDDKMRLVFARLAPDRDWLWVASTATQMLAEHVADELRFGGMETRIDVVGKNAPTLPQKE